jgi:hypothetical protein
MLGSLGSHRRALIGNVGTCRGVDTQLHMVWMDGATDTLDGGYYPQSLHTDVS